MTPKATLRIADAVGMLLKQDLPGLFTAYDGSSIGTGEVPITVHLKNQRGLAYLLTALDLYTAPAREVALIAPAGRPEATAAMAAAVRGRYRPHVALAGGCEGDAVPALLADRPAVAGAAAAYVCEHFACKAPVTEPEELERLLS